MSSWIGLLVDGSVSDKRFARRLGRQPIDRLFVDAGEPAELRERPVGEPVQAVAVEFHGDLTAARFGGHRLGRLPQVARESLLALAVFPQFAERIEAFVGATLEELLGSSLESRHRSVSSWGKESQPATSRPGGYELRSHRADPRRHESPSKTTGKEGRVHPVSDETSAAELKPGSNTPPPLHRPPKLQGRREDGRRGRLPEVVWARKNERFASSLESVQPNPYHSYEGMSRDRRMITCVDVVIRRETKREKRGWTP